MKNSKISATNANARAEVSSRKVSRIAQIESGPLRPLESLDLLGLFRFRRDWRGNRPENHIASYVSLGRILIVGIDQMSVIPVPAHRISFGGDGARIVFCFGGNDRARYAGLGGITCHWRKAKQPVGFGNGARRTGDLLKLIFV